MSHTAIGLTVYGSLIALLIVTIVITLWLIGVEDQVMCHACRTGYCGRAFCTPEDRCACPCSGFGVAGGPRLLDLIGPWIPQDAEVRSWPQAGGWHDQADALAEAWAAPVSARERLEAEAAQTRALIDRAAALFDGR